MCFFGGGEGSRPGESVAHLPTGTRKWLCIDLIKRLSAEFGLTVLFCEHNMELVFSISHEMMVLRSGRTIIQDRAEVVRQDQAVQEAYLGGNR
jgi:ABC-type branched-subunit amino acid transport system ATPase component